MNELPRGTPEWWNARYLNADAPWDTGIVPPEVVALIESGEPQPGWALDLGCGSGVTSRYLAANGFRVVGVDLALSALSRAAQMAARQGLAAYFCQGDVTDLGFVQMRATLAVDVGCFHAVLPERRPAYVASLAERLLPGALYLLYTFEPFLSEQTGPSGLSPADLSTFAPRFGLRWAQHGFDRERLSAWHLWQRAHV
ncbi:MAG: class I SAM-dependent methyltransferase [Anaerolineae bacterium]|jgi:SAM-dependent methyltransferase|nr:class I SAM-dependent methyltransferase [Anaerolineae bacterium]